MTIKIWKSGAVYPYSIAHGTRLQGAAAIRRVRAVSFADPVRWVYSRTSGESEFVGTFVWLGCEVSGSREAVAVFEVREEGMQYSRDRNAKAERNTASALVLRVCIAGIGPLRRRLPLSGQ